MTSWNPFASKTYTVACPDGPKTVYRSVDEAFPLVSTGIEAKLAARLTDDLSPDVQLEAALNTKVAAALYDIDQANKELMIAFRSAYMVYKADPCNKVDYLEIQTERLIEGQFRLRSFYLALLSFNELAKINNAGQFDLPTLLAQILDHFNTDRHLSATVSKELSSATDLAKALLERLRDR